MDPKRKKAPQQPTKQERRYNLRGGKPRSHYINFLGFGWMTRRDAVKLTLFCFFAVVGVLAIINGFAWAVGHFIKGWW